MAPTVDIEATSATTARATLTGADVPPMDLTATANTTLAAVVHEFVHTLAAEHQVPLDVVYRTGTHTRFLTVSPDGTLTETAPSTPLPVTIPDTAPEPGTEPEPDPDSAAAHEDSPALHEPITVATEPLTPAPTGSAPHEPSRAAQRPSHAPPRPEPTRGPAWAAEAPTEPHRGPSTVAALSAPSADPTTHHPARLGVRGRINTMLGLTLTPKTGSLEMRLRAAQHTLAGPVPEGAVIAFANVKGGVGKTPMALALADTIAEHRGPATVACLDLGETGGSFPDRIAVPPAPDRTPERCSPTWPRSPSRCGPRR